MIIKCTKCYTAFMIDDKLIKEKGTYFRCSECKKVFKVHPEDFQTLETKFPKLRKSFEDFEYALRQVLKSAKILEEYENQKTEAVEKNRNNYTSASDLAEMFLNLYILLKKNDLEAEESFNILKSHLTDSDVQNDLNALEKYISRLDFKNAIKILKTIAQALDIPIKEDLA